MLAGYAFVVAKADRGPSGRWTKTLRCKRGGGNRNTRKVNETSRTRASTTVRNGCTFAIRVRERPSGLWNLGHIALKSTHNHSAGEAGAFPEHRRLTDTQKRTVEQY